MTATYVGSRPIGRTVAVALHALQVALGVVRYPALSLPNQR